MLPVFESGHGYTMNLSPGTVACTLFDNYETLSAPLGGFSEADRERRVFPRGPTNGWKTTYGSHAVKLARVPLERAEREGGRTSGTLAVLMAHGGGHRVSRLRVPQCRADIESGLLAMSEDALYFLLYAIAETVEDAHGQGVAKERARWLLAGHEGRIRKRRAKGGRPAYFDIFEPYEMPRGWTAPPPPRATQGRESTC